MNTRRRLGGGHGREHRLDEIIDEDVVPQLLAVAENRDRLAFHGLADKPVDDAIFAMLHLAAGAVRIGNAEDHHRNAVNVMIEKVEVLRRVLVQRIGREGMLRVVFRNGNGLDLAELQP